MGDYLRSEILIETPRLPLEGSIDLTYRCSNSCRHCWLRLPPKSKESQRELRVDEIKSIVEEARKLGCRKWSISGGEPMLRSDFLEIFDYITRRSGSYSINTNGTLITAEIAALMRRKGRKMIALYGATPEVHDHITRTLGSFQATMKGFKLLQEAGSDFIVQLVPMKDNYHQFKEMVQLAKTLSPRWRVGASWLYLSADGDSKRNEEIKQQRLPPKEVIELDKPYLYFEEDTKNEIKHSFYPLKGDGLFATCINHRRNFHIDPYGMMTFCSFIKDQEMMYDLRKGNFRTAWEEFIPSLADKACGGKEYLEGCRACEMRSDCRWCPAYGYLEHRRFSARVDYLCQVSIENRKFRENWEKNNRVYVKCAGITIRFESDQPIVAKTFFSELEHFSTDDQNDDKISITHRSELPFLADQNLGEVAFQGVGWEIRKKGNYWIYLSISNNSGRPNKIGIFNHNYTNLRIFSEVPKGTESSDFAQFYSDLLFLTQIALSQVLASRGGCFLKSEGMMINKDEGILFIDKSCIGNSILKKMLISRGVAKPLSDGKNIVRRWPEGYFIYDRAAKDIQKMPAALVPLKAIFFVESAMENRIIPLGDSMMIAKRLLPCVIMLLEFPEFNDMAQIVVKEIARIVPCFVAKLNQSGEIADLIEEMKI